MTVLISGVFSLLEPLLEFSIQNKLQINSENVKQILEYSMVFIDHTDNEIILFITLIIKYLIQINAVLVIES